MIAYLSDGVVKVYCVRIADTASVAVLPRLPSKPTAEANWPMPSRQSTNQG